MAKTWKGYAAATLTATLMMGMIGPSYAGTLTLAGFGADQQIEESKTEAASTKEEAPKTEETSKKEVTQTEAQTEAKAWLWRLPGRRPCWEIPAWR